MADDKYIIRPGGLNDKSDNNGPDKEPLQGEPSLEEYVFANSVVQSALIQLLVEKGIISLEDLGSQVEKIRSEM